MKLKRIRDLREDNDLTQADIAKYLNVTQRTYSRYENDDRAIPLEQLVKLAEYYNTSVDYLLNRTDKKSHIKKMYKSFVLHIFKPAKFLAGFINSVLYIGIRHIGCLFF